MASESEIKKLSTGVQGLDDLLYGGIPESGQILLLGEAGSGKTLLAFEIAYKNASSGVPTTFFTIEENKKSLINFAESTFTDFSDLKDLIENKTLHIEEMKLEYAIRSPESLQATVAEIIRTAGQNNSKLLVIDSFSLLRSLYADDRSFTRGINYIIESIRSQGIATLITFETAKHSSEKAPGLFEESMFDGIIRLSRSTSGGHIEYLINVVKMRYSKFQSSAYSLTITPSGIIIQPKQVKAAKKA